MAPCRYKIPDSELNSALLLMVDQAAHVEAMRLPPGDERMACLNLQQLCRYLLKNLCGYEYSVVW